MLKHHTPAVFVDFSEFTLRIAKASHFEHPIQVEAIAELSLLTNPSPADIRDFVREFVDLKGGAYCVAHCGMHPEGRFLHYFEAESIAKLKDPAYLPAVLESEFKLDTERNAIAVLNAADGIGVDWGQANAKKLLFCGAPLAAIQAGQDELLTFGVYPRRLELSTVACLGGLADFTRFSQLHSPVLYVELTRAGMSSCILYQGRVEVVREVSLGLESLLPILQQEVGVTDRSAARKLLFANSFDFAAMGPKLLRRVIKELQASAGLYEVQTGLTIDRVLFSALPEHLDWITPTLTTALGMELLQLPSKPWIESLRVRLDDSVNASELDARWLGLFSLMAAFHLREEAVHAAG